MRVLAWILVAVVGVPVAWLLSAFVYEILNESTFRQRLTIEVEVDGEVRSASSVHEITTRRLASWLPQGPAHIGLRGEATVIELNDAGALVALLLSPSPSEKLEYLVLRTLFPAPVGISNLDPDNLRRFREYSLAAELTPVLYPTLIYMEDLNDPTSATVVDPQNLARDLSSNIKLRRISIETTRSAVTHKLERQIPWVRDRDSILSFGQTLRKRGLQFPSSETLLKR